MKNKNKLKKIRPVIQILFFVLIGYISINHVLAETGKSLNFLSDASLHALCPFGGVATFVSFITSGTIIKKLHESALILMYLVLLLALFFGPVFCGWVCPLGSIQEWFGKIGKRIFKKKYNNMIPKKIDAVLRYLRYVVLILVVIKTTQALELVFINVDPYFALFKFWTDEAAIGGIIVLIITLILSLFVERPWCKYACPFGALLGIFNLFRIFKIRRNPSTCINCNKCSKACPMNIEVAKKENVLNHQCITCMNCTSEFECPVENTVTLSTKSGGVVIED